MLCQAVTHEALLCDFKEELHMHCFHALITVVYNKYTHVTFLVWERAKNQEYDMEKTHI